MKKTLQFLLYAFFLMLTIAVGIMLIKSWKNLNNMKAKVSKMEEELRQKNIEYMELRQEIYNLKNNPHAVEKVAREKYKLARKGETVYVYKEKNETKKDEEK